MDSKLIQNMAMSINDVVVKTGLPLYRQIREKEAEIKKLVEQRDELRKQLALIRNQYNKDIMHFCKRKPPEIFDGFKTCLSCKMRETCRAIYKPEQAIAKAEAD